MKVKFTTCIYSNLYGTDLGGRLQRGGHYKFSLLSLLKMNDADFVCYTSEQELEELKDFYYNAFRIDETKLKFKVFDLRQTPFKELIDRHKNLDFQKTNDRCYELQYMKFIWSLPEEGEDYDYYYWIDAGLSHSGLIPPKHMYDPDPYRTYFESPLFNNKMLSNLVEYTNDKFLLIGKENARNYWSRPVNAKHYTNFDSSIHIIGGLFGGKKELWSNYVDLFVKYVHSVLDEDKIMYDEENIMTLIFRNHEEIFKLLNFDTWWHEKEVLPGIDMIEHTKINKSFYKILEELNNI